MVLAARSEDKIQALAEEIGGVAVVADVTVDNAGVGPDGVVLTDSTAWDSTLAVNLTGVAQCMRHEIRAMTDGGAIVNNASTAAFYGTAFASDPRRTRPRGVVERLEAPGGTVRGRRSSAVAAVGPGVVRDRGRAGGRRRLHGYRAGRGLTKLVAAMPIAMQVQAMTPFGQ